MPRRQGSILDNLIEAPWWASVVLAVGLYVLLKFLVPLFASSDANFALKGIIQAVPQVAWLSFILLLATPLAAYRQWRERRLLDKQEDLATIPALTWRRFETLVAEAYRRQGYEVFRPSGNGPDGGVDLVLKKDGNTILVQCKQWRAWKVGVKVVRELYGVMTARHAQGAILVTSGIFTHDARTFAAGKPLDLVEGAQLAELIRSVQSAPAPPHRSAEL